MTNAVLRNRFEELGLTPHRIKDNYIWCIGELYDFVSEGFIPERIENKLLDIEREFPYIKDNNYHLEIVNHNRVPLLLVVSTEYNLSLTRKKKQLKHTKLVNKIVTLASVLAVSAGSGLQIIEKTNGNVALPNVIVFTLMFMLLIWFSFFWISNFEKMVESYFGLSVDERKEREVLEKRWRLTKDKEVLAYGD